MCGIFGVSGSTPAVPLIAAGLKKLEYSKINMLPYTWRNKKALNGFTFGKAK